MNFKITALNDLVKTESKAADLSKFASLEVGQIVSTLAGPVFRVISKTAGADAIVIRLANLAGKPVDLTAEKFAALEPISPLFARIAARFRFLGSISFNTVIHEALQQAGIPSDPKMNWDGWFQTTYVNRLFNNTDIPKDDKEMAREAAQEVVIKELWDRGALSKMEAAYNGSSAWKPLQQYKNLPPAQKASEYLKILFGYRYSDAVEIVRRNLSAVDMPTGRRYKCEDCGKEFFSGNAKANLECPKCHSKEVKPYGGTESVHKESPEGEVEGMESTNTLDTMEHATVPNQETELQWEDIKRFSKLFEEYLKQQRGKQAKGLITLWNLIVESVVEDTATSHSKRNLYSRDWEEATGLGHDAFKGYLQIMDNLFLQFIEENPDLAEKFEIARLVKKMVEKRHAEEKKEVPTKASSLKDKLSALNLAASTDWTVELVGNIGPNNYAVFGDDKWQTNAVTQVEAQLVADEHNEAVQKAEQEPDFDQLVHEEQMDKQSAVKWCCDYNFPEGQAVFCDKCGEKHDGLLHGSKDDFKCPNCGGYLAPKLPLENTSPMDLESLAGVPREYLASEKTSAIDLNAGPGADPNSPVTVTQNQSPDQQQAIDDKAMPSTRTSPGTVAPQRTVAPEIPQVKHGADDVFKFNIDGEKAFQAVMARFGQDIGWDQDTDAMVAPRRYKGGIEELVFDSGGVLEDVDEIPVKGSTSEADDVCCANYPECDCAQLEEMQTSSYVPDEMKLDEFALAVKEGRIDLGVLHDMGIDDPDSLADSILNGRVDYAVLEERYPNLDDAVIGTLGGYMKPNIKASDEYVENTEWHETCDVCGIRPSDLQNENGCFCEQCWSEVSDESKTSAKKEDMSAPAYGSVCGECGRTVTKGEYSSGESTCCHAEVTAEEFYGKNSSEEKDAADWVQDDGDGHFKVLSDKETLREKVLNTPTGPMPEEDFFRDDLSVQEQRLNSPETPTKPWFCMDCGVPVDLDQQGRCEQCGSEAVDVASHGKKPEIMYPAPLTSASKEELVDDWCGSCYGEDPEMSNCQTCKGTGINENRKVRPPSKKAEETAFQVGDEVRVRMPNGANEFVGELTQVTPNYVVKNDRGVARTFPAGTPMKLQSEYEAKKETGIRENTEQIQREREESKKAPEVHDPTGNANALAAALEHDGYSLTVKADTANLERAMDQYSDWTGGDELVESCKGDYESFGLMWTLKFRYHEGLPVFFPIESMGTHGGKRSEYPVGLSYPNGTVVMQYNEIIEQLVRAGLRMKCSKSESRFSSVTKTAAECAFCGEEFTKKRKDDAYCSNKCQQSDLHTASSKIARDLDERMEWTDGHTYHLTTWQERDRFHIYVVDESDNDREVLDLWDEDAAGFVEDGYFDWRNPLESCLEYAESVGLLKPKKAPKKTPSGKRSSVTQEDWDAIRPGDRLTILVPGGMGRNGREWTQSSGRVVMRSATGGWVLNMGGQHGTPGLADFENTIKIVHKGERKGVSDFYKEYYAPKPKTSERGPGPADGKGGWTKGFHTFAPYKDQVEHPGCRVCGAPYSAGQHAAPPVKEAKTADSADGPGKYKVFTGPTCVQEAAKRLTEGGLDVVLEGTEHVYVMAPDRESITKALGYGRGWTWRDIHKIEYYPRLASKPEITNVRKSGDMTLVEFGPKGIDGHCSLAPKDIEGVKALEAESGVYKFKDEQGINWAVTLMDSGDYIFKAQSGGHGFYGGIPYDKLFLATPKESSHKLAALRFRARQEAKVAGPIDWFQSKTWPTQLVLVLATLLAGQQGVESLKAQVAQELQDRGKEVPAALQADPNAKNHIEVEDMEGNSVPDQTEIVPDAPEPNIVPLENIAPSTDMPRLDHASLKTAAPSWLDDYDRNVIPVQVVGVQNGKVTPNGHGYQEFANLAEAKKVFPSLDPDHNLGDFSWAMRGEIKGQPAMRFETWPAYRMYST